MTIIDLTGQLAAGLRMSLVLFAAMILMAGPWRRAITLIALATLVYSPGHAASLLGYPAPRAVSASLDTLCSALACAGFIAVLASQGVQRGLSAARVRRGVLVNMAVVCMMVGAAWLTR